ncbi:MAG TPA: membrane protein insertase YidC [Bacillota bacterium]|nr:membrane protein insertase YidC [Bacillota bacterium]HPF42095.1 membrane protein insertase YidC [Bacillota bacterium]HPJ85817.1 membrane protein insertase YidC [Bacillota bacterium]HPQ61542.1 membrane protein insertase YidC [Bacillota bacterium]HRX91353.1 membrane protein insertase YidC [Candidatus Izemoplasmatales bacterium]
MKKTKIIAAILLFVLVFALSACGSKAEVSYENYTSIVTVSEDETNATSYYEAINLLGTPSDESGYANGDGVVVWSTDTATVTVTFTTYKAVSKTQEGLSASGTLLPIGEKDSWTEWVVMVVAKFTFYASNLFGLLGETYYYWLGLLIMTLVIRTLAWPIYSKSNDMTLKMQIAQPEITRIQEKYKGRSDQASQQRMQMETMEVYRKYKINFFGCLMPLLQMPIFIAMYTVVRRFPITPVSAFGNTDAIMNYNFLWTDLGNTGFWENLPLALVVVATMMLSQWLIQKQTRKNQKVNKYQNSQAQQSQKMMKYMNYFMVLMMGYIAISNAGIAFYWILGNSYQLLQSYLSRRNIESKQEKMRSKF